MEHLIVPENYEPAIGLRETQVAIKIIKDFFQRELAKQLNLTRVSAPLFVLPESGLNDNLNARFLLGLKNRRTGRRRLFIHWQSGREWL